MVSNVAPKFNPRLKPPLKFFRAFSSSTSIDYPPLHNHPQWSGLHRWRRSPINDHRYGGPAVQFKNPMELKPTLILFLPSLLSLAEMVVVVLCTANPLIKAKLSHLAYAKWREKGLPVGVSDAPLAPARPIKPLLKFLHPEARVCLLMGTCFIIFITWS